MSPGGLDKKLLLLARVVGASHYPSDVVGSALLGTAVAGAWPA
jgi:membrane-associated phospholipid phosphatase